MNLSRLRQRRHASANDPQEENHQAVFGGLLDVLLIGMGAAATLVIIFAVLPKQRGWSGGTRGTAIGVAPTRAEQISATRAELKPVDAPLVFIKIEALNTNSSISPDWIDVLGMEGADTHKWVIRDAGKSWRRIFVSRQIPSGPGGIRIVCQPSEEIDDREQLLITVLINGVPGCARAVFSRETRLATTPHSSSPADYFQVVPADASVQAIPARSFGDAKDVLIDDKWWFVAQVNTDLRGTPVTGYTQRNLPNP